MTYRVMYPQLRKIRVTGQGHCSLVIDFPSEQEPGVDTLEVWLDDLDIERLITVAGQLEQARGLPFHMAE